MKALNFNETKFVSGGLLQEAAVCMLYTGTVAAGFYAQMSGDSYLLNSVGVYYAATLLTTEFDLNNVLMVGIVLGASTLQASVHYGLGYGLGYSAELMFS